MGRPKKIAPNRSDGRYEVKITIGHDLNGKPIRKSFYSYISKADAKLQADEYKINDKVSNLTGLGYVTKNIMFSEWALEWLARYKKDSVGENTYVTSYERPVMKSLIPYFKHMNLLSIKEADVQSYINIVSKKYSESQIQKRLVCLKAIFHTAIKNDLCYKNPAEDVTYKSSIPKREIRTYTQEEVDCIIAYSDNHRYGLYIRILLELGLRYSELSGLKWSDFNLLEKTVYINRSATTVVSKIVVSTPKTETSMRKLPITTELFETIKKYYIKDEYVLLSVKGNLMRESAFKRNRYDIFFRDLQKNHPEIQQYRPHELRHTCGTLLYKNTKDIYAVSKYLGHANVDITTRLYVHNDVETLRDHLNII